MYTISCLSIAYYDLDLILSSVHKAFSGDISLSFSLSLSSFPCPSFSLSQALISLSLSSSQSPSLVPSECALFPLITQMIGPVSLLPQHTYLLQYHSGRLGKANYFN